MGKTFRRYLHVFSSLVSFLGGLIHSLQLTKILVDNGKFLKQLLTDAARESLVLYEQETIHQTNLTQVQIEEFAYLLFEELKPIYEEAAEKFERFMGNYSEEQNKHGINMP